jgi:hypothetical protein
MDNNKTNMKQKLIITKCQTCGKDKKSYKNNIEWGIGLNCKECANLKKKMWISGFMQKGVKTNERRI